MTDTLYQALLGATIAGGAIPCGGLLARIERIKPDWLEQEFRHSIIAFGGGVLLAAVALVLVPEGMRLLPLPWASASFVTGGMMAFLAERAIERHGASAGQLFAMLLDFVPEAVALGAAFAAHQGSGMLLALLIAAQNLPEGFNAYRELAVPRGTLRRSSVIGWFGALALLGPLAAWLGHRFFAGADATLGALMLAAAGGILYLTFQSIAPQTPLKRHWAPPLGAVAGFLLGLVGQALLG